MNIAKNIRNLFIVFFFFLVVFGFTLCMSYSASGSWGQPGTVRYGFLLMASTLNKSIYWLATRTSSVPTLPQHILKAKQIVGQMICGCIGVPVPPLAWTQKMLFMLLIIQ